VLPARGSRTKELAIDARIRDARSDDAAAIVAVAAEVWPEEPLDADQISCLIADGGRATSVAELGGQTVGFVDGFLTTTAEGVARWEVDLLAVSPRAQGRGLGRLLVAASIDAAIRTGATTARGLIRVGNVASERVFAACGFAPDERASQLWISTNLALSEGDPSMHIVQVRTFRYIGIWLEALRADVLGQLQPSVSVRVIGAVIPVDERDVIAAAERAGMSREGEYRFWHRDLQHTDS
jgi:GNAT superfamily N-acetyltransferase